MTALIVKEDGLIYVNEVPEKPKFVDTMEAVENCLNDKAMADWRKAIKDSAILVSNQEVARELLFLKHCIFPKEIALKEVTSIYPIPDLKFTINTECPTWCSDCEAFDWSTCKDKYLAILTPSLPSKGEQESQLTVADLKAFIDRELGGYKVVHMGYAHKVINRQFIYESDISSLALELLQNFTITRRNSQNQ